MVPVACIAAAPACPADRAAGSALAARPGLRAAVSLVAQPLGGEQQLAEPGEHGPQRLRGPSLMRSVTCGMPILFSLGSAHALRAPRRATCPDSLRPRAAAALRNIVVPGFLRKAGTGPMVSGYSHVTDPPGH